MAFTKTLENIAAAVDELDRLTDGVRQFNAAAAAGTGGGAGRIIGAQSAQPFTPRGAPRPITLPGQPIPVLIGPDGRAISATGRADARIGSGQFAALGPTISSGRSAADTSPQGPATQFKGNLDLNFIDNSGDVLSFGSGLSAGLSSGSSEIVGAIGQLETTVKNLGLGGGTAARNAV